MGRVDIQAPPLHRLLRGLLEQLTGGGAEVLRDVDLLGRAARPRGRHAAIAGGAAAIAEEVGEELVEEAAPATEGRPRRSAGLRLELPQVLFADCDRPLFAVLPDPNRRNSRTNPIDLADRGGHLSEPPRSGLAGTRWLGNGGPPWLCRMLLLGAAGRVGCRSAQAARQPRPWSW